MEDPSERKELSKQEPEKLQELLQRYNEYVKEPRHMQDQGYHDPSDLPKLKDACDYMKKKGGYWQPWQK